MEQGESFFAIPLRPDVYRAQTAGRLTIHLDLKSAHAMRDFQFVSKAFPMQIAERTAKAVKASFEGPSGCADRRFRAEVWAGRAEGFAGSAHLSRRNPILDFSKHRR